MNRILFFIFSVFFTITSFSQQVSATQQVFRAPSVSSNIVQNNFANSPVASSLAISPPFWSEDFSGGLSSWVNSIVPWEYRGPSTSPNNSIGSRGAYASNQTPIQSPSSSNGFVIFDSDYYDNGGVAGAFFTGLYPAYGYMGTITSPSIDCSNYPNISLKFNSYYREYASTARIAFSTDGGISFTDTIEIHPLIGVNESTSSNEQVILSLPSNIAGQSDVRIQFIYDALTNTAGYYFWMIDDIVLYETTDHLISLESYSSSGSITSPFFARGQNYTFSPLSHAKYNFDALVKNLGAQTQTNLRLNALVSSNGSNLFSDVSNPITLNPNIVDTLEVISSYYPLDTGLQNISMWASSDFTSTDTVSFSLIVSDSVYAIDNDWNSDGNAPGLGNSSWSIGRSCGGQVGASSYEIFEDGFVSSISFHVNALSVPGANVAVQLYEGTGNGSNLLSTSQTYQITPSDLGNWVTLSFLNPLQVDSGLIYMAGVLGFLHPTDTFELSKTENQYAISYIQDNGCNIGSQSTGQWYYTTDPMAIRMNTFSSYNFCEDFESYNSGDPIAESSPNWNTWGELLSGFTAPFADDAYVTNNYASTGGSKSLGFNLNTSTGGPEDIVLPFSNVGTSTPFYGGTFEITHDIFVENKMYFNIQADNLPVTNWALDVFFDSLGNVFYNNSGISLLYSTYPINSWFEQKIVIDITNNNWQVFHDGNLVGSFSNPTNQISSIDYYPTSGDEFYVDNICLNYIPGPAYQNWGVSTLPENKKVVLEQFSGIYNLYSPDGDVYADQVKANNPNDVFLMRIYAGTYNNISNPNDPDLSSVDGTTIHNSTLISGYPSATINRSAFGWNPNGEALYRGNWQQASDSILLQPSPVNIAAQATYDYVSGILTVDTETYYTATTTNPQFLHIAVLQDNIAGPQSGALNFNPNDIISGPWNPTYNHRDVLRHLMDGYNGMQISSTFSGSLNSNTHYWSVPYDLSSGQSSIGFFPEIVATDLKVIAFVAEGTQEIYYAVEVPVIPIFSNDYDVYVVGSSAEDVICASETEISITFRNYGSQNLISCDFTYGVNGGTPSIYSWSGNMDPGATETITIPNVSFSPQALNTYSIYASNPNGQIDQDSSNNISSENFEHFDQSGNVVPNIYSGTIYVDILTDAYGSETSWEIIDEDGVQYANGGQYSNNTQYNETAVILPGKCYSFNLYDSYGDGMCCSNGLGIVLVYDSLGNIIFDGNASNLQNFTEINSYFSSEDCDLVNTISTINPSDSTSCDGTIIVNSTSSGNIISYLLTDQNGVVVSTNNFGLNLCNGMYFLSVTDAVGCTISDTIILGFVYGCMDISANNYNPYAMVDDGSCIYPSILGCTDTNAINYFSGANTDDGSCIYCDLTNTFIISQNTAGNCDGYILANSSSSFGPVSYLWNTGSTQNNLLSLCSGIYTVIITDQLGCSIEDTIVMGTVSGCTDPSALNFDPFANSDDGSCQYCDLTNSFVVNNNTQGNCDGFVIANSSSSNGPISYLWSTGSTQNNILSLCAGTYSITITDNVGCTIEDTLYIGLILGCTDPIAMNYDPNATIDDGSCTYSSNCTSPKPTGLYSFDVIDTRAKVGWDNMNDPNCMVLKYFVRYREVGTSQWTTKSAGVGNGLCLFGLNTVTKQLLNLNPSTTYEFRMKAFYCGGTSSNFSTPVQFTTADPCPDMTNLTTTTFNNNQSKVRFNWDTTGAYTFARILLRVDVPGSNWQTAGGFGVNYPTLFVNKFGLTAGQSYRAQGRTFCDPNITAYRSPTWTSPIFWSQPGSIKLDGGTAINNLDVYPNPSRDVFNISFSSDKQQDLRIRILNVVGAEIYKEDRQEFVGEYIKQISLDKYGKGIYFLEIETSTGVVNKKLILQ